MEVIMNLKKLFLFTTLLAASYAHTASLPTPLTIKQRWELMVKELGKELSNKPWSATVLLGKKIQQFIEQHGLVKELREKGVNVICTTIGSDPLFTLTIELKIAHEQIGIATCTLPYFLKPHFSLNKLWIVNHAYRKHQEHFGRKLFEIFTDTADFFGLPAWWLASPFDIGMHPKKGVPSLIRFYEFGGGIVSQHDHTGAAMIYLPKSRPVAGTAVPIRARL
jgi:hypothetical protein